MIWNPFEFITQTKNDFTSLFDEGEKASIRSSSRSAVVEINIGKSAIIEMMEGKIITKKANEEKENIRKLVEI